MSKFSNRVLAVTAALCLVSGAASAQEMHISYQGLNLARPQDAAIFKARMDKTAQKFCNAYVNSNVDLSAQRVCQQAIVDEAEAKLPDAQREALSGRSQTEIVSARR